MTADRPITAVGSSRCHRPFRPRNGQINELSLAMFDEQNRDRKMTKNSQRLASQNIEYEVTLAQ